MCSVQNNQARVDEHYYRHAGRFSFVRRVSALARKRVYDLFLHTMQPQPGDRILDVGTSDVTDAESNMLEQLYPHRSLLTCASLSNGEAILKAYSPARHVKITPGQPLPFKDNEYDIVYSNAVIEHAGCKIKQEYLLREMCRVAPRRFFIVPNRGFPIEPHTGLPFIHYLPQSWFRRLLRGTAYDIWSHEENLNYVSANDLRAMWPNGKSPMIAYAGIGLGRWKSNMVVFQR